MPMKLVIVLGVVLALGFQASAEKVTVTASNQDRLNDDQKAIIAGLLEVITAVIDAKGNVDQIEPLLADIKARIEAKIASRGPEYLHVLAGTLSQVVIPDDTLAALKSLLSNMAEGDGLVEQEQSREKRSAMKKGKKGKGKKGKKKKKCGK